MTNNSPISLTQKFKNKIANGQKRAAQRSWKKRNTSKTKKTPLQQGSPQLARAINNQVTNNPNIHQSLKNREKVKFEVKGGQLIAKNKAGEILYQGNKDEFKGHENITVNATPEKRRLGELLLDKQSLKDKQKLENRDAPHLSPTKSSKTKLGTQQGKNYREQEHIKTLQNVKNSTDIATAPVRAIGNGVKRIIIWGRTPAGGNGGQGRDRGGR